MFRNQYDNDITTWSPQGRIHQIEYAMEAVKQGSACVAVKSKTHAVLVALKRSPSELSSYQPKVFELDKHVAMGISGLSSDARSLARFMRSECLDSKWSFDEPLPISRLVNVVADKLQRCTQVWSRRPFGVGLLVVGTDSKGPHVYQIEPSAMFYDCRAMAIGSRSQSARTYLERNIDAFASCDKESLIRHALLALRECLPTDASLTADNTTVAVASPDAPIAILNDEDAEPYIALVKDDVVPRGRAAAAERPQAQAPVQGEGLGAQPGADAPAPMDDAGDDV